MEHPRLGARLEVEASYIARGESESRRAQAAPERQRELSE